MPLYSKDALRELSSLHSSSMRWWKVTKLVIETTIVLWLLTRSLGTNTFAHATTCLLVILIADVRLNRQRATQHQQGFGLTTWEALRAVHERLDSVHPPNDEQRSDPHTGIGSSTEGDSATLIFGDRIALPLEGYSPGSPALPRARHWGTSLLRREIGNVDLAMRRAGGETLPTLSFESPLGALELYRGLAAIALVQGTLAEFNQLASLIPRVGTLILAGAVLLVVLLVIMSLTDPYRTWEREALKTARARGVEAALASITSTRSSCWKIYDVPGERTRPLRIMYDPLEWARPEPNARPQRVAIVHGEDRVFDASLSADGKRLRRLHLFHDGDWVKVLTSRAATATEEVVGSAV